MKTDWDGFYLDGATAGRKPVTVRILRLGLQIDGPQGESHWWPYEEVHQTQGNYSGEQVRLERGGELADVLIVPDADFLVSLRQLAPEWAKHYHNPLRRRRRMLYTVYAGLGVVGVTMAMHFWGIPALANLLTPLVPLAWEEELGRNVVQHMTSEKKRCSDPQLSRTVESIVATLTAPEKDLPYKLTVHIADNPNVNAVALPGGTIVLFRGLVEATQTPEELAGVLAHELQHVFLRHTTRALIQHFSTNILVALLVGDAGRFSAFGVEAAQTLGTLRYSRQNEEEADVKSLEMLVAAGIEPKGIVNFFETMSKQEGDGSTALRFLSTHPTTNARIAKLRSMIDNQNTGAKKLFRDANWEQLKKRC